MGIFSFVKPGKKIFKTITSVKPKVNKTKLDIAKSKLAIATQKTKASGAKLKQTLFESKNKAFKGQDDFTFATNTKKTLSNTELKDQADYLNKTGKYKVKKATGGRVGLKRGTGLMQKKSNIQKIKETFGPRQSQAKNLKSVDKKKNPGLAKLPIKVRNKMGYAAKGGRAMLKTGSKFPDLNKDGKITKADILMGRGVIKKNKKKVI